MINNVEYIESKLPNLKLLVLQYGYQGLSLNKITQCLGIKERTLYKEYGSKKDILKVLIEYEYKVWKSLIDKAITKGLTPKESIIELLDIIEKDQYSYKKPLGSLLFNLSGELGCGETELQALIAEQYNKIVKNIAMIITGSLNKQCRNSEREITLFIVASVEGSKTLAKSDNDFWELKNGIKIIKDYISNILISGIA